MTTAAEKYSEFESLRSRFGENGGAGKEKERVGAAAGQQHRQGKKRRPGSGRRDPRASAPPLVPLVEEEAQVQTFEDRPLIIGKWKHSHLIKSNHLNGPDFDALETASESSAYSSESSVLSPPCGSVTELSDAGSCDNFMEYDLVNQRKPKVQPLQLHLYKQKIRLEDEEPVKFSTGFTDLDVRDNFVQDHVTGWNRAIGDWKFKSSPVPSPSSAHTYRVTNEIRLPTPISTPQGSTDNLLLDCGSRSSLGSAEDWTWKRSNSTSNLISAFQSASMSGEISHVRSFSGTDLLQLSIPGDREEGGSKEEERGKGASPEDSGPTEEEKCPAKEKEKEERKEMTDSVASCDSIPKSSVESAQSGPKVLKRRATSDAISIASRPQPTHTYKKVSERIQLLGSLSNSTSPQPQGAGGAKVPPKPLPSPTRHKWLEAYNKSKVLKTVQETEDLREAEEQGVGQGVGPPANTTTNLMQRAKVFGETKKCIQRRRSFAMGDTRGTGANF